MTFRTVALATLLVFTPSVASADDTRETTETTVIDLLAQSAQAPTDSLSTHGLAEQSPFELLSVPFSSDNFYVAGVTWQGSAPEIVDIRVLETGAWSDWYTLEVAADDDSRGGTEPFIAGNAEGVQVRVSGVEVPDNLALALTDGQGGDVTLNDSPELSTVLPAPGSESASVVNGSQGISDDHREDSGQASGEVDVPTALANAPHAGVVAPKVVTRAGWGENRVPALWKTDYRKLGGAVIHHTAGTNTYAAAQAPSVVRAIHDYHTYSWGLGWDDIGYNFLVDRFGTIYEGRYGTLASSAETMVVGGHAAPANYGSMGISVMGTYTGTVQPSAASLTAIEDIVAWRFSLARVDPQGKWTFYDSRAGANKTVNAVLGHKDVSATLCPGNIYGHLQSIRNGAQAKISAADSTRLTLFKTNSFAPIADEVQYFGQTGDEFYVGNVLGRGDFPFIRRGNTFSFAQSGSSPALTTTYTVGSTGQEVFTGDILGAGKESLILRTANRFDIYENPAVNKPTRSINYGKASDEVFVFDWDGDGKDEITVRRGNTFYLKWSVASGNADKTINYGRPADEVYVGSWKGGSTETIMVRRGNRYYMNYTISGGPADLEFGYGRATDRVVVGDWNRDGKDGVGVVR